MLLNALLLAGLFALWSTLGRLGNRGLENNLDDGLLSWGFSGSVVWLVHWLRLLASAGVVTSWLASWSAVVGSLVVVIVVWIVHWSSGGLLNLVCWLGLLVHWLRLLGSAGVVAGWLASWGTVGVLVGVGVVWVVHLGVGVLVGVVHLGVLVLIVDLLGSLSSLLADIRALGVTGRIALVGWLLLLNAGRLALLLAGWLALGLSLLDLELDLDHLWGLGGSGWSITGNIALLLALWLALGSWLLLLNTGRLTLLLAYWLALLILDNWSLGCSGGGGWWIVHWSTLGLALLLALWLALGH